MTMPSAGRFALRAAKALKKQSGPPKRRTEKREGNGGEFRRAELVSAFRSAKPREAGRRGPVWGILYVGETAWRRGEAGANPSPGGVSLPNRE